MKKAALLLLLLFPGCLVTAPMGANKETGGDGDKSAVADSFLLPPSSVETPPVDVPPAAPPSSPPPSDAPPPPLNPSTMMRSLPGGDDAAGGDFHGDRALAYVSPGPIDPKTDQGQAEGLPCATHHLKYGANFSFMVMCFAKTPMLISDPDKPLSFTFLLEKKLEGNDPNAAPVWVPETGGYQVRLVYQPAGKEAWESSYVDAITDATPDDGIVGFSGIPAAAGSIYLSFLKSQNVTSPDYHSVLQPFASREVYENFMNPPLLSLDFVPVGSIQLTPQMSTPSGEFRRAVLPPQSLPSVRGRIFLKDISPSEP